MRSAPRVAASVRPIVWARLVSSAGAEAAFFVGIWGKAAYEFQGTPSDLAWLAGIIGVAAMVGSVVGGALVDRFDARRVAIGAETLFVPATLSLILADDLVKLLLLSVFVWLAGAILETAITSMPPSLVDDEGLDAANARLESANWMALVIGPALGAVIFPFVGFSGVFVLDAVGSVIAIVLIFRVDWPESASRSATPTGPPVINPAEAVMPAGRAGAVADVISGLRYAMSRTPIRLVLILGALPSFAFGMFTALEPLFFRDVVGAPVETLGYVNAVFGIGLFGGSWVLERVGRRVTTFRVAVVVTTVSGLASVVYVATGNLAVVVLGAVLWSVPLGLVLPLTRTLAQRSTEPEFVGRVTGSLMTVSSAASLLPVVVAPVLAVRFGVQGVLIGAGLLAGLGAPALWRAASREDRNPTRPRQAAVPGPSVGALESTQLESTQAAPQQTGQ